MRGNAITITPTKALCALHGAIALNERVELYDHRGIKRTATVLFQAFEELVVDIALLELTADARCFDKYVPVASRPVKLSQEIYMIGMIRSIDKKDNVPVCEVSRVTSIETSKSLFRSNYTGYDGLSGAGVIVLENIGNEFRVAGVHVATHDDTESPPIKKLKGSVAAEAESVSQSSESLAKSIHGHTAYSLICEVQRVPELFHFIT